MGGGSRFAPDRSGAKREGDNFFSDLSRKDTTTFQAEDTRIIGIDKKGDPFDLFFPLSLKPLAKGTKYQSTDLLK